MTGRERVVAAIERQPLDRIPRFDAFWEDTIPAWEKQGLRLPQVKKIIVEGAEKSIGHPIEFYFDMDIVQLYMDISMRFPTKVLEDDGETITVSDRCGYTLKRFKNKTSSVHFLSHMTESREEWDKYKDRFRLDPRDSARVDCEGYFLHTKEYPSWDGFRQIFSEYRKLDKFIAVFVYGPWEETWRHHGYENSLMDMAVEPDMMEEMFRKAADLLIDTTRYMISVGCRPDAVWLAEDMGCTRSTLFSRRSYRDLLWPYHKKIGDFLHENGLYYFMHSCGFIEPFLPDLIEAGLDVIQALQANTGMTLTKLKPEYGDRLTFFGNISEQSFKNGPEAVEAEMREKIPTAMEGGGYIYHSDHSIPPEVSFDTYLHAMRVLDEIGAYH